MIPLDWQTIATVAAMIAAHTIIVAQIAYGMGRANGLQDGYELGADAEAAFTLTPEGAAELNRIGFENWYA